MPNPNAAQPQYSGAAMCLPSQHGCAPSRMGTKRQMRYADPERTVVRTASTPVSQMPRYERRTFSSAANSRPVPLIVIRPVAIT